MKNLLEWTLLIMSFICPLVVIALIAVVMARHASDKANEQHNPEPES